ncbi:hypothetical protein GGE16_004636 [Rhizobium leguminosarum]|uniref:CHAD domain-containing protein n=1 Tax=Rhizobium leguminosarum TaxID=384 RepID=A0AAE2SY30_RHILE|nr:MULTISPECIES: CHAD domain-containing protein [Rhizobium]MBB4292557.1 hypothetical protein [Rhizobium leguminosarum]
MATPASPVDRSGCDTHDPATALISPNQTWSTSSQIQLKPELPGKARVALRRLRSAFSLFKPLLPGAEPPLLKDELRWLSGVLDVLLSPAGANPSNKIDPSNKPPQLSNSI